MRANLEEPPTYRVSPNGRHLAVYVQPTGTYNATNYLDNLGRVAAIFIPAVFDRWTGVQSFDVCQEPLPTIDASPEPPPVTELTVTRSGAHHIRWRGITLADLIDLATPRNGRRRIKTRDFGLYLNDEMRAQLAYQAAIASRP
jgi:hypothetical protein